MNLRLVPCARAAALAALTMLPLATAPASTPTGATFGRWHVTSISSLSGDGAAGDASAILVQENKAGSLNVDWVQGGGVTVSISIPECGAERDEFSQSYTAPAGAWKALNARQTAARLRADFTAWLAQARLACGPEAKLALFQLAGLKPAAADFLRRLRAFDR